MTGLLLLALAALAWLVAGVYYALDVMTNAGLLLVAAGFAFAFWASRDTDPRPGRIATGLGLAFVGMLLFLGPGLGSFVGTSTIASHVFALGLAAAAVGSFVAPAWLPRLGWGICALAALLWVYSDFRSGLPAWQPGNIAALVGAAWLAYEG